MTTYRAHKEPTPERVAEAALNIATRRTEEHMEFQRQRDEAFELLRQWVAVVDLSGMTAEDGAIPDNPSLNPVTELLRKTRALTAK